MQRPQRRARFDAELVAQRRAKTAIGGERLRLPPGPVEREDPLRVQPFAQRVLDHQPVEVGQDGAVMAELELGVEPAPDGRQPPFVEPAGDRGDEGVVGQVGQDLAPPQRQGLVELPDREGVVPLFVGGRSLGRQRFEPGRIDRAVADLQPVAARLGDQHLAGSPAGAVRLQHLAQMEDVGLQAGQVSRRRVFPPDGVGQPTDRDGSSGLAEQQCQDGPLLTAAERQPDPAPQALQRPQDAEFEPTCATTI